MVIEAEPLIADTSIDAGFSPGVLPARDQGTVATVTSPASRAPGRHIPLPANFRLQLGTLLALSGL